MIDKLFEIAQDALLNPSNLKTKIKNFKNEQKKLNEDEYAKSHVLLRLLLLLEEKNNQNLENDCDLLILLRQIARYFNSIKVSKNTWDRLLNDAKNCSLYGELLADNTVNIIARDWETNWLSDTNQMDILVKRNHHESVLGDGILSDMTAYKTFRSEGQRRAIQASIFAEPGTTTLITLPTGGGKSFCVYLPAWVDSKGGQFAGGTTIVIVPTVALAIDQCENARRYFKSTDELFKPHYVARGISQEERSNIRHGIKQGTIPLLFISPESLLNSEFHDVVEDATKNGYIKRLVIDETHLVDSWGVLFRTGFQLLSSYFFSLYELSGKKIRIVLLSATISESSLRTLKKLFSLENGFNHVQINQLRPEIGYWMYYAFSEKLKEQAILEAIYHLPRPAIVYFTSPKDAELWYTKLKSIGFSRISTFTGETDAEQRLERIKAWRNNQIDLMLATSAFGLGVDKGDVRSIIHATFPENLDRFYQEVGRGGRDGFSTISLVIVTQKDKDSAKQANLKTLITPEKAYERWKSMFKSAKFIQDKSLWSIDIQALREPSKRESEMNQNWNEHVLLAMQRFQMIRIVAMPLEDFEDFIEIDSNNQVVIEILSDAVNTRSTFLDVFSPKRQEELSKTKEIGSKLIELYDAQTQNPQKCISETFETVYDPVSLACGGCPYCRQNHRNPYSNPIHLEQQQSTIIIQQPIHEWLTKNLGGYSVLQLLWEKEKSSQLNKLVQLFIELGIDQFIVPDGTLLPNNDSLLETLENFRYKPHLFMEWKEWDDRQPYHRPLVVFLPAQEKIANRVYRQIVNWQRNHNIFTVYVLQRDLTLSSLNGRFVDKVNGHTQSIDKFINDYHLSKTKL
jgi:ATP-dependent DNA helicase RecQ